MQANIETVSWQSPQAQRRASQILIFTQIPIDPFQFDEH